jgi:hypothetical protein
VSIGAVDGARRRCSQPVTASTISAPSASAIWPANVGTRATGDNPERPRRHLVALKRVARGVGDTERRNRNCTYSCFTVAHTRLVDGECSTPHALTRVANGVDDPHGALEETLAVIGGPTRTARPGPAVARRASSLGTGAWSPHPSSPALCPPRVRCRVLSDKRPVQVARRAASALSFGA